MHPTNQRTPREWAVASLPTRLSRYQACWPQVSLVRCCASLSACWQKIEHEGYKFSILFIHPEFGRDFAEEQISTGKECLRIGTTPFVKKSESKRIIESDMHYPPALSGIFGLSISSDPKTFSIQGRYRQWRVYFHHKKQKYYVIGIEDLARSIPISERFLWIWIGNFSHFKICFLTKI